MHRILAATDGSDVADRAVDFAADLASKFTAELVLVCVIPGSPTVVSSAGAWRAVPGLGATTTVEKTSLPEALKDTAKDVLTTARVRAERRGARHIHTEIGVGEPADTIISVAKEREADVMVLGKRGRGRLTSLLLGSVSQKVVANARCTVIVVP